MFLQSRDTETFFQKSYPISLKNDFQLAIYLIEDEFVAQDTIWSFGEARAKYLHQPPPPKPKKTFLAKDEVEESVLVFNETKTSFGREFYRIFMENWQPPDNSPGFWVTIRESLTAGRYTLLTVSLNNRELFQRYLVPRSEYISDLAKQTADYILSLVKNGNYDGSLSNDDLFGKGIE